MNAFGWLVKREYWEHRGGFFWAQIWTACIVLLLILSAMVVGEALGDRTHMTVSVGVSLNALTANMSQANMVAVGHALDGALLSLSVFPQIVLFFVVFFYLLGALYDDRKDRSVLFWKSLPISDIGTVGSKLFSAAITAPVLAFLISVAMQLVFLVLLSIFMLLHDVNPGPLIWQLASPLRVWSKMLVLLPINALWALPTYGWLLLCSSFARSRPIVWAILPLALVGWAITFSGLLRSFSIPSGWYFQNVFLRLLLSIVPGGWMWNENSINKAAVSQMVDGNAGNAHDIPVVLNWSMIFDVFSSPDLWIGVVGGLAMLAGAVYFRQRRIESMA